ncbi:MAG: hypothetical protein QG654_360 [Patescibacteria group bacterium]|nr:hypothetical protein [Patescibacteria group bacterium]
MLVIEDTSTTNFSVHAGEHRQVVIAGAEFRTSDDRSTDSSVTTVLEGWSNGKLDKTMIALGSTFHKRAHRAHCGIVPRVVLGTASNEEAFLLTDREEGFSTEVVELVTQLRSENLPEIRDDVVAHQHGRLSVIGLGVNNANTHRCHQHDNQSDEVKIDLVFHGKGRFCTWFYAGWLFSRFLYIIA